MRQSCLTSVALLALAPFGLGQAQSPKLEGDLPSVLARTGDGELIPVTIVMTDQVPIEEFRALGPGMTKADRREYVKTRLKEVALGSQAELLADLRARVAQGDAADLRPLWIHNVVGARLTPAAVKAVAERADVSYVHYDAPHGIEVLSSLPALSPGAPTCGLNLIHAPDVWAQHGITGAGVVVGVIDTGLCTSHSDIKNQLWTNPCEIPNNGIDDEGNGFIDDVNGWNFESNNKNVGDNNGHGSHTAGTVGGDGTGGTQCGVAPDAQIMVLKFFNNVAGGEQSVWDSMQYGLDNGADVLTASLGWAHSWGPDRPTWRAVCENTIAGGVVVVYAAGNEGCGSPPDNVRTPGDVPDVLTVGAVNCSDQIAGFSSCGPITWQGIPPYDDFPYPPGLVKPDVSAHGVDTTSHATCSGYVAFSGTSMATPHVAGAAALILQADPTLDHFGVKNLLEATAVDLGAGGKDNSYGSGRIDALAAVQTAIGNGNFCAPKASSCGPFPLLEGKGRPSATLTAGYVITATGMAGKQVGLLIYGDQGAANIPILGGSLCVASFHRAIPLVDTLGTMGQCNGVLSIDMNTYRAGILGGNPQAFLSVPGTTVHCQMWGRDSANTFGALLTAGWSYTVCP